MRLLLLCLLLAGCASPLPPQPEGLADFKTDGCSRFPDRSRITGKDWCDCCLRHDVAYWRGGSEDERLQADQALLRCVLARTDEPGLAAAMYAGVRAGGGPEHATSYRWAYGWPPGRGYKALSAIERSEAERKLAEYQAGNPTLTCTAAP